MKDISFSQLAKAIRKAARDANALTRRGSYPINKLTKKQRNKKSRKQWKDGKHDF